MEILGRSSCGKEIKITCGPCGVAAFPVPAAATDITLGFSMPVIDVQCHWHGKMANGPQELLPWRIADTFSFQSGFCFAAFFNRDSVNALSFGLLDHPGDVFFSALMNQATCSYDITLKVCFEPGFPKPRRIRLYLDESRREWQDALEDWRRRLRLKPVAYPQTAFDPVFCTWYAVHAAVTARWCEQVAAGVRSLGFKTFILDDGWCYDDSKRVTPETIHSWYEWIGDWQVSARKFPDFKGHVRKMRKLGFNYMVWVAPFLVGKRSGLYGRLEAAGALQGALHEGHRLLNPENAAGEEVADRMVQLLRDSGIDGLKVDFLDEVKSEEGALRGEACRRFITELVRRLREVKPDILLEYRQNYATMQMASLATQFRAGDAPFDFMVNFKRLAAIRLCMGDGVPVHADPAYWNPGESPETISCHCIAMLAGVPMLSMDPRTMGEAAARIVPRWLAFYELHRGLLNHGHWTMRYSNGQLRYAAVADRRERIVILADGAFLLESLSDDRHSQGILLNLASPIYDSGMFTEIEDCFGNRLDTETPPVGGLARFEL